MQEPQRAELWKIVINDTINAVASGWDTRGYPEKKPAVSRRVEIPIPRDLQYHLEPQQHARVCCSIIVWSISSRNDASVPEDSTLWSWRDIENISRNKDALLLEADGNIRWTWQQNRQRSRLSFLRQLFYKSSLFLPYQLFISAFKLLLCKPLYMWPVAMQKWKYFSPEVFRHTWKIPECIYQL